MKKTVTIDLDTPLTGHGGPVTKIVLREPSFTEYVEHGDPYILVPLEGGGYFPSEDREALVAYMKCCVVEPDYLILYQADFKVARRVKDAILSFFLPAGEAGADSRK